MRAGHAVRKMAVADRDDFRCLSQDSIGTLPTGSGPTQNEITFPQLLQQCGNLWRQCFSVPAAANRAHLVQQNVSMRGIQNLRPFGENMHVRRHGAIGISDRHSGINVTTGHERWQSVVDHAKCFPAAVRADVSGNSVEATGRPAASRVFFVSFLEKLFARRSGAGLRLNATCKQFFLKSSQKSNHFYSPF